MGKRSKRDEDALDALLVQSIRDAVEALCAKFTAAHKRGISVNFNIGQSGPDTDFAVQRLDISKKL